MMDPNAPLSELAGGDSAEGTIGRGGDRQERGKRYLERAEREKREREQRAESREQRAESREQRVGRVWLANNWFP